MIRCPAADLPDCPHAPASRRTRRAPDHRPGEGLRRHRGLGDPARSRPGRGGSPCSRTPPGCACCSPSKPPGRSASPTSPSPPASATPPSPRPCDTCAPAGPSPPSATAGSSATISTTTSSAELLGQVTPPAPPSPRDRALWPARRRSLAAESHDGSLRGQHAVQGMPCPSTMLERFMPCLPQSTGLDTDAASRRSALPESPNSALVLNMRPCRMDSGTRASRSE